MTELYQWSFLLTVVAMGLREQKTLIYKMHPHIVKNEDMI